EVVELGDLLPAASLAELALGDAVEGVAVLDDVLLVARGLGRGLDLVLLEAARQGGAAARARRPDLLLLGEARVREDEREAGAQFLRVRDARLVEVVE